MRPHHGGSFRPSFSASIPAGTKPCRVPLAGSGGWVRATNASTATAFVAFGDGGLSATVDHDIVIPPGHSALLPVPGTATHIGAVLGFGTGGIFFTRGERYADRCL